MIPRRLSAVGGCVLALAIPAVAAADTHYVAKSGGSDTSNDCTSAAAPCATITHAVGQALDGDTIQIAAGIYEEAVTSAKVLEFVGVGSSDGEETEATIVRAPDGGTPGVAAFVLFDGGALRSLRAEGGDGDDGSFPTDDADPGGPGVIVLPSGGEAFEIQDVDALGGEAGSGFPLPAGGAGLRMAGGGAENELLVDQGDFKNGLGAIVSESAASIQGLGTEAVFVNSSFATADTDVLSAGINVDGGAEVWVESGFAFGNTGAAVSDGSLTVRHSFLAGVQAAVLANPGPSGTLAEALVTDSLVLAEQEGALASTIPGSTGSASLTLQGSTVFVTGAGPAAAVRADATGGPASLTLRNTIARHDPDSEAVTPTDLLADRGSIVADFSNFTTAVAQNGGTVPTPGSANNVAGPPAFDFESGGTSLELSKDSPLIDRGDPSIVEAGQLALNGEPRSLDGDANCVTAPDIGAYELEPEVAPMCLEPQPPSDAPAADPPPVVSAFGITNAAFAPKGAARQSAIKRGTKFTYTLSEPARVTITIERKAKKRKGKRRFVKAGTVSAQEQGGRQSVPFSGRVKGKALKPGRYRATIVATDSAGQRSQSRRVQFRIVRG